jgi:hypothetical protein
MVIDCSRRSVFDDRGNADLNDAKALLDELNP